MGYDGYIEVYPKQDDNPDYVLQDHTEFMRLPAPFESVDFYHTDYSDFLHDPIVDYYRSRHPELRDKHLSCCYFKITPSICILLEQACGDSNHPNANFIRDELITRVADDSPYEFYYFFD